MSPRAKFWSALRWIIIFISSYNNSLIFWGRKFSLKIQNDTDLVFSVYVLLEANCFETLIFESNLELTLIFMWIATCIPYMINQNSRNLNLLYYFKSISCAKFLKRKRSMTKFWNTNEKLTDHKIWSQSMNFLIHKNAQLMVQVILNRDI